MNSNEYMKKYMREYRKRNPQKVAEYNRRYWEKRIEIYNQEHGQSNEATGDTTNEG